MTRAVKVKDITIGGGAPITVQSMTNTPTLDTAATLAQIQRLAAAGCDIVRLAVSSLDEAGACRGIIGKVNVPLVADIQFDYRLAVACADIGFDKIRFNPGNIGGIDKVREVVAACKANGVPIRVGVNGGSLDPATGGKTLAERLVNSALSHADALEKCGFYDTVLSVKSSDVRTTIEAYTLLSKRCDYPLHLGVTESGAALRGTVKSAVGIGTLLYGGIGDTIRVSLTGDPVKEVEAARLILQSLGLCPAAAEIVSCPTCSRCKYRPEAIVEALERRLAGVKKRIKIAVMGCVVNGPGEAAGADIAVCGGAGGRLALYERGKYIKTIDEANAVQEILALAEKMG